MNSAEDYTYRYLETDDLDQYNALLRYTFQVTEEELTATGWKDDEIKQSKFPVLERADVLGCFDGKNLVSQFAVYPRILPAPCPWRFPFPETRCISRERTSGLRYRRMSPS